MENTQDKVRSLWIPMRKMNLLMPNVAVAEVGSYRTPTALPDTPEWLMGTVNWQGKKIAVISLESMCGISVDSDQVFSRLMIVNSVRPDSPVSHYAIVTAGLPGLIQFGADTASDAKAGQSEALKCTVHIGNEEASIPDLEYLQGQLEEQLGEAA
ncbi:MAG: chemotaxis protein CheW [Gammaproteobacteria bacterium]|nr:chemotaxis protein CheW [Gammaproteobacteria bacterium]